MSRPGAQYFNFDFFDRQAMTVQSTQRPLQYPPGSVAQGGDAAVFERAGAGIHLTVDWITAYAQAAIGNGQAISFGSTAPANTVGEQDDVFFNITTGEVLRKGATIWAVEANFALDTDVTTAITAAITAHTGAADPHPTYLTQAEATALYKPLTTDDSAGGGLRLTLLTATTGTPASGQIIANNATLSSITQLLISETDRNGAAIANLADLLADTLRLQVQNEQSEDIYCYFRVSGAVVDSGTYRTVPVVFVSKPTAITTLTQLAGTGEVSVGLFGGAAASTGGGGSGLKFFYEAAATIADDFGVFARNGASFAAATQVSFSVFENQSNNADTVDILQRLTTGAIFEIRKSATAWARYRSTGTPVLDVSGTEDCYNVAVASEAVGPDAIADTDTIYLSILSDTPGVVGTDGVTSGQMYVLTTGATTASGRVRFAGGTLFLHESDRSTPTAVNLTTLWQNLTPGSIIQIIDETTPTNYINYTLGTWTGTPPKNGAIYELPASITGSNGTIADSTDIRLTFSIKGPTGIPGSGSTITVQTVDGTVTGNVTTIIFPNGSLSVAGNIATVTGVGGGGTASLSGLFTSWWNLNEMTGNRNDLIGTNHLIPVNAPASAAGLISNAASFAGNAGNTINQQCLEIASNASLAGGAGENLFLTAAIYLTSLAGNPFFITKYDADTGAAAEWIFYLANNNRFAFDVYDRTNNLTGSVLANTFGTPSINTWYIVQMWFDFAAKTANIVVNNSSVDSVSVASNFNLNNTSASLRVGCVYNNYRYGMAGRIDCMGLTKTIPSAAQRALIYNNGAGVINPNL
jgi:hypothetical protein